MFGSIHHLHLVPAGKINQLGGSAIAERVCLETIVGRKLPHYVVVELRLFEYLSGCSCAVLSRPGAR